MIRLRSKHSLVTVLVGLTLAPGAARAEESYRVSSGQVTVTCPLTIGGSFEAVSTAITGVLTPGDAGAVKGALAIDLRRFETGISLRDRHLRNNYLEVQKSPDYAVAKFENIKVDRLPGKTTFRGTLTLHGQQREVSGTADLQPNGRGYRLEATFSLRISDFKIPEPTYLGVGVKDEISLRVAFGAEPAAPAVTETASR